MPEAYQALARARVHTRWPGYRQPEDFGYEFYEWVSPYTKGAHALGGVAIVLQDWSSAKALRPFDPEFREPDRDSVPDPTIQEYGRDLSLRTNCRLQELLAGILEIPLGKTYATNAFPFVKPGPISNRIPMTDVLTAARMFLCFELEIVQPTRVLALGRVARLTLNRLRIDHVPLPHPAARIGTLAAHERRWREALS